MLNKMKVGTALIPINLNGGELGPKMKALTELQRNWVLVKLAYPSLDDTAACRAAGYGGETASPKGMRVQAQYLRHCKPVQEAMKEMAEGLLASNVLLAAQVQTEILGDPTHKDRAKISEVTLARAGLGVVNRSHSIVEHRGLEGPELIREIAILAQKHGMNPQSLLKDHGVVIDAEYKVVEPEPNWEFEPDE